jgi:serine/threonine-protein kinase
MPQQQDDDLDDVPTRVHATAAEPRIDFRQTAIGLGAPTVDAKAYAPLGWDDDYAPTQLRPAHDDDDDAKTQLVGKAAATSDLFDDEDNAKTQVVARHRSAIAPAGEPTAFGAPSSFMVPPPIAGYAPPPVPPPYARFESGPPPAFTLGVAEPPRRSPSRWPALLALGLLAFAAAAAASFLWLRPQRGRLVVDVAVEGNHPVRQVEVFLDGRLACAQVPCVVDEVPAGGRIVRVVAPGFVAPEHSTENVVGGGETSVKVPVHSIASRTGVRVTGDQPGVKAFVDGIDHGPLPARIVDLAPGSHLLRLAGSDRYKPLERTVDVVAGNIVDLGAVALEVRLGRVTVDLVTPDAKVVVVRGGIRKVMSGPWPMSVDVDPSEGWKLMATKPGYRPFELPLDFSDGQALSSVRVDLEKR